MSDLELVGDLGCIGVDVDVWRQHNRLPTIQDAKSRWLLAYSTPEQGSYQTMVADILEAFGHWFGERSLQRLRDLSYNATAEGYRRGVASRIRFRTYLDFEPPWENVTSRFDQLPQPPALRSGGVQYLWVEFDYHGTGTTIPWPVYNSDAWTTSGKNCPHAATMMLAVQARSPEAQELENVTENPVMFYPRAGSGLVVDSAADVLQNASEGASRAIDPLFWKLLIAGGAMLGGYALINWKTVSVMTRRPGRGKG